MPSLDITGFQTEGFRLLCEFVTYENFPGTPAEAMERLHRIIITTQGGQMSRSRVMFKMVESMLDHEPTEDQVREVYVLGWAMELLQFVIITSDDIVDQDHWRRGRWAWHCQPGVGLGAVFDSFVGAFLALAFLKKHLGTHLAYILMVESINQELLHVQPMQSWGHMDTAENLKASHAITNEMAVYYQSQNDYLDLYGTKAQNGKEGSDIQGNKCSWLIVEALKNCNSSQREILKANYGRDDQECAEKVKVIFEELDMSEAFQSYKKNTVTEIERLSQLMSQVA
ncbi:uncharacterized protein TRUGW13939_06190 [Talaromyces rugulosus]|uniref:Farnesyl diphosphate synthase n=1 Tax=Talaromyces rugulosus TaxID=121627 RepID=A0A7H8QY65_TALRU|nr:uncharacterized protein TRUGW13939_06190 [Talaromyces rugulosus]QKX59060.1 hypothetical protein TRUGW13939_06190 [Talaromyces rugulosus]